jgi:hypothetical protein
VPGLPGTPSIPSLPQIPGINPDTLGGLLGVGTGNGGGLTQQQQQALQGLLNKQAGSQQASGDLLNYLFGN